MKRNGFTLIELLAVIVILAIIALIAVPIVIGIIDNTKKSANQRSIENYIHAAELAISQSILEGNNLSDGYHNIEMFDVKTSGEIPDYGYLEIKEGKIVGYHLNIDNKSFSKTEEKIENSKESEETKTDPMKAAAHLSIDYVNQEIIKGISFSYEDKLSLNFYIDKEKVKGKNIYLRGTHTDRYDKANNTTTNVNVYNENNKYYIFSYNDFHFMEFTNNILFEVVEDDGTEEGKTLETISYDLSAYANNKIYNTKSEFEKEVLISLMNLGTSAQVYFNYQTNNLANKVLNEEDIILDTLTKEGKKLYDNTLEVPIDIENNVGQYFSDNGIEVSMPSAFIVSNFISVQIRFKKTTPIPEEEIEKYGLLIFDEEDYNYLKTKGIECFNSESQHLYDNINIKNEKTITDRNSTGKILRFYYNIPMQLLANNFYIIPYYIDSNGIYKYGKLIQYNVILSIKQYMDSNTDTQTDFNLFYMILDFCELIKID